MRYLLMFAAILLIACAEKHTAGGYYSTTTKDTTAYIGRMKYHDFEHDTSFSDTILIISDGDDSLKFWYTDFYLGEPPYTFYYKRMWIKFQLNSDNSYEHFWHSILSSDLLRFHFYGTDMLEMTEKTDQKDNGILIKHQVYSFEGEKYSRHK
jgi:hypothetical protein